jgi:hypothetical protein
MELRYENPKNCRRRSRLMSLITVTAVACVMQSGAQAQTSPQPPYALFDQSTITGSGDTITVSWVPVVTAAGAVLFKNLTIQFHVDSAGNLTIASGYPQVVPAPTVQTSSFRAGNYVGPSGVLSGKALISVSGPGVTSAGATEWSLAASTGANASTYPASAAWYAAPIASSPLAARLAAAKITSTAWSYGVVGSQPWTIDNGHWFTNSLIGVSQVGNTLTLVTFTDNNSVDHNTPQDQITYTLIP